MTDQTTPPTPQGSSGGGCCGIGCTMLVLLIFFFGLAFVGGAFFTARHYSHKYTSSEPAVLPEDITSEERAPVTEATPDGTTSTAPVPRPPVGETQARWKSFEKAADRNQTARIELSAGEINALLQRSKNTRGKVFVSIENNVARVRFSVPLKKMPMVKGRYVNGEATIKASPDGDPAKAEISEVVLANQSVSDAVIDRRFFGWPSARNLCMDWLNKQNIATFRIENNRVISETRAE